MKPKSSASRLFFPTAMTLAGFALLASPAVHATTFYWDNGAGNNASGNNTNWATTLGGGTDPAGTPNSLTDDVYFNILTLNTNQTMGLNGSRSYLGITFNSTGATNIENHTSSGTSNTLTIGSGGITVNNGAGTAGLGNNGATGSIIYRLADNQIWANNSNSLLTIGGSNIANVGNTTPYTLTLGGSGTAGITINSGIADGGTTGTTAITVNNTGGGTTTLVSANSYSGKTTITAGILSLGNALAMQNSVLDTTASVTGGATDGLRTTVTTLTLGGLTGNKNLASVFTTATGGTTGLIANGGFAGLTALTLNPGSGVTNSYSGAITNGAATTALNKTGLGTQTLAGANTYTGNTTVTGGTLNITGSLTGNTTASTLALGTTAANTVVNVSGNMTLFNVTGSAIANSNAVYNQTAGTVTISPTATSTFATAGSGNFNLTGGTYNVSTGGFLLTNGATATGVAYVGGTGNLTLANTSNGGIVFNGTGALTVGPGGTMTRANGAAAFYLNVGTNSTSFLNVAGGNIDLGTGLVRFGNGGSVTGLSSSINLAGGTLTMGAVVTNIATSTGNFYANFAGGTLKASAALSSPFSTGNGVTTTSTIFGAITNNNNANTAFNTQIGTTSNFTGGLTIDTNGNSVTYGNALLGANTASNGVKQTNITVTGGTGYIGAPLVQFTGGTLATNGSPATGYAVINAAGAVTGVVITSPGEYSTAPTVTLTGGGGTGASIALSTLSANVADSGLTKIGANTLTLSSATVNTYTGATTVNAGTLALNYANLAAPTNLVNSGSALVLGGGTLSMSAKNTNTSQTFAGTTLNSGGSAISVTPNGAGAVFVLGGITRNSGSTVLFTLPTGTQNSTYGITTTATNTATSILGGWATTGNDWAVTGASGTNNVTALSSYFTYDNVAGWIGAGAGATSNMTDGSGYDATYTNSITLNSLRFNASGSDSNLGVVSGNNLTVASGGILVTNNVGAKYQRIGFLNNSFNTGEGQGGLTSSGTELLINQNNSSTGHLEIYSSIFGTGVSLVKSGAGFLDLKGLAASYDGATTINGGTLQVSGGNDRLPTGTTLTINNGTFQLASVNQNVAGLAGSATAIVDNFAGTNTLTVSGAGSNNFAGVIKNTTGTLNLTQSGAGIQTLSGANTYTGTTTVASGTLVISGNQSSATGAVSVNGTLAGSGGTVGGNTTINAGGHLAVGDGTAHSTGKETFTGKLTFVATSIFDWDISSPITNQAGADQGTYDQVINTNAAKMSGTSVFNVILGTGKSYSDAFWDTDKTWTNVFSGTGVATDLSTIFTSFTDNGTPLIGGLVPGEGTFTFNGSTTLTWSAVPEPTSALAGLLLTAGLLRRRRRTGVERAIPNRDTSFSTW